MDPLSALTPFFTGQGPIALAATTTVMVICAALGALIGRGGRADDVVVGMGLGGGVLSIAGVAGAPIVPTALGLAGIAWICALVASRRGAAPGGGFLWPTLVVMLPFLLVAASTPAMMWDDFWHWLPNAAYVFREDHIPGPGSPQSLSQWPAYPYTLPFISALASRLAGGFLESAGPIANTILLGVLGAAIVEAAAGGKLTGGLRWAGAGAAAALGTYLNPAYNHEVVLATYADTGTAAAIAICGLSGVRLLTLMERERSTRGEALRFALAAVTLVNLKQANPVPLVLLALGLAIVAARIGRPVLRRLALAAPLMYGPAAAVFLIWRIEVARMPGGGEMRFRPLDTWNFDTLGRMTEQIGGYMADMPIFYALMWGTFLAGAIFLVRGVDNPSRRAAAVLAPLWLGYNLFLILVYLGAMTHAEAEMAADYWRYTPHLGYFALAAAALPIADRLRLRARIATAPARAWILAPIAGIFALVVASWFSPLAREWPTHYRAVGREAAALLPEGARVAIYVGHNLDAMGVAARYDLMGLGEPRDRNTRAEIIWHGAALGPFAERFRAGELTHLLITDRNKPMDDAERDMGVPRLNRETALFARTGNDWRKIKSWPLPPERGAAD